MGKILSARFKRNVPAKQESYFSARKPWKNGVREGDHIRGVRIGEEVSVEDSRLRRLRLESLASEEPKPVQDIITVVNDSNDIYITGSNINAGARTGERVGADLCVRRRDHVRVGVPVSADLRTCTPDRVPARMSCAPDRVRRLDKPFRSRNEKFRRLNVPDEITVINRTSSKFKKSVAEEEKSVAEVGKSAKPRFVKKSIAPKIKFVTTEEKREIEEKKEHQASQLMAVAYEQKIREYKNSPYLRYLKGGVLERGSKNYQAFFRAAKIAQEIGCPFRDYIEAQFYWFHQWFRREARPFELCGMSSKFNAEKRAKSYLSLKKIKGLGKRNEVIRAGVRITIPTSTYIRHGERLLQDLMKVRKMTEEEVFLKFGRPDLGYFDLRFLRTRKIWKKLHTKGLV